MPHILNKFVKMTKEMKTENNVIFAGLVEPQDVPKYIKIMDLVVHCSLREGLARVLPQALIAQKPVISYDIDGAREVVINNETGFLIKPKKKYTAAKTKRPMVKTFLAPILSTMTPAGNEKIE